MKVTITQLNEPPAIPAQVESGIVAAGGGQAGATLLPAQVNVVTAGSAGVGVGLNPAVAQQQVFARFGYDLAVYPPLGGLIEGVAVNLPVTVLNGHSATFTFDATDGKWLVS